MDEKLIHILREITPEENQILNGNKEVQKNLYTNDSDFTVDSKKMLTEGELIAVRTHTRFVHFPLHRHNYVEVIYVCEGSITNVIDEKKVEICKGELLF
ncbi:MAG: AraC family transcriptional regulator, partial [Lachnospiraceae bacterium]